MKKVLRKIKPAVEKALVDTYVRATEGPKIKESGVQND